MGVIAYSLSGEGRGHAARARVIIELLRTRHRVIVYTYGAAYQMLEPLYAGSDVEVHPISGMRFVYDKSGTLNRAMSLARALPFVARMPLRAEQMAKKLEKQQVDLSLVDFEPLLPRASHHLQIPTVSLDHQQFLVSYDLSSLPPVHQRRVQVLAPFVRPYYKRLRHAIISAFFFPKVRKARHPITQVGVLLRDEILRAEPNHGDHLVCYVRREAPRGILRALEDSRLPVIVYGHPQTGRVGRLLFKAINPTAFAEDLGAAHALVTTAGNQVIGESLFLQKPVFAFPEPGNFEQHINGFFLQRSGTGWSREVDQVDGLLLRSFAFSVEKLREAIRPERLNGNNKALAVIEAQLKRATVRRPEASPRRDWTQLGASEMAAHSR